MGERSPKELPGAVCPQSPVDLGSSVSTLREEMLRFTSSCRHSVVHRKMQPTGQVPCWEDEHLSRNVYFVHKINTVFNYYAQTSSRVILEVI